MPLDQQPRRNVLIVEDDPLISAALVAVGTVTDGLAALDGPRFAILDMNLPDGPGTTVLAQIRADGRPIRVAVATGTTDQVLLADAEKLRPELVLRKPYDVNA